MFFLKCIFNELFILETIHLQFDHISIINKFMELYIQVTHYILLHFFLRFAKLKHYQNLKFEDWYALYQKLYFMVLNLNEQNYFNVNKVKVIIMILAIIIILVIKFFNNFFWHFIIFEINFHIYNII